VASFTQARSQMLQTDSREIHVLHEVETRNSCMPPLSQDTYPSFNWVDAIISFHTYAKQQIFRIRRV
jgi:hypothetical protein